MECFMHVQIVNTCKKINLQRFNNVQVFTNFFIFEQLIVFHGRTSNKSRQK